jgi:hypothetical protein
LFPSSRVSPPSMNFLSKKKRVTKDAKAFSEFRFLPVHALSADLKVT